MAVGCGCCWGPGGGCGTCIVTLVSYREDEDEEVIVKAMSDYWVVGKKSDQRELYVILNQKNANLIEVNGK